MIVDTHTHTYPEKIAEKTLELLTGRAGTIAHTNGRTSDLKKSMTEAGVDVSIVLPVATSPKQYERINETAYQTNESYHETGIWSFGGIHPANDNYKEILRDIKNKGLKGLKLHPDYQDAYMNDIRYKRIIDYASELDLAVVVHAGLDIGLPDEIHCTPDMIVEILEEVKPTKLILAHLGGWQMWDEVYEKICGRNVYLDTAFSYGQIDWIEGVEHKWKLATTEQFLRIIERHGADKILFATDSPWSSQKKGVEDIKNLPVSDEVKDKILGENAKRLLGL
ncbi:MAG: amidohydrolase family protein [Coprococcus sp.]|nr:amidohydrolase family protein [Coprococcus sp.]